jgi:hypothetical protein
MLGEFPHTVCIIQREDTFNSSGHELFVKLAVIHQKSL